MPEQVLRDAENPAGQPRGNSSDGAVNEARSAETFLSTVSGRGVSKVAKGSVKGSLKKKGPLIAIAAILAIFVGLIFAAQSLMPFAIVNRLIEEFNTNGISSVLRADNILDLQLAAAPGSTLALDSYQKTAMEEHGLYPFTFSYSSTFIAYRDHSKEWKIVIDSGKFDQNGNPTVSPNTASNELMSQYPDVSFEKFATNMFISVEDAMKDGAFKNSYIAASKTWRGGNSGWYDELTDLAEEVHGFKRSRWFGFEGKKVAQGITAAFKDIAKAAVSDNPNIVDSVSTTETVTDKDGVETRRTSQSASSGSVKGLDVAAKFVDFASTGATVACAAVEGFMGVQTVISTYQKLQKINLTAGFMEAVQSVQAGGSSGDPMNEYSNKLTDSDPETGKNAISSAGMDALFNGTPISTDDNSVKSVNTENALAAVSNSSNAGIMDLFSELAGNARGLLNAYKVCNYVKGGLALANMVITAVSVIPIFGQIVKGFQITFRAVFKAAVKTAIKIAAPIIAKELISYMGRKYLDDMATEWVGENLGNALVSGGNTLLSVNHQTGGGSPGSPAKVSAFRREQNRIIAEEAEYQRSIRSPFDTSSQYTFLGSIIYGLIPIASSSGVGSTLKNVSSVMTNATSKLLPTAAAVAETSMVGLAKEGDCPILQNMETKSGAVVEIQADVYCNPIYISDQTSNTDDYTPEDIIEYELDNKNITKNGNTYKIVEGTNLAKYITYCGQRTSSWGIADANIANAIASSASWGILSQIPIISDVSDIVTSATNLDNLPWTTGSACVASDANEYWCENKIHQRFIEDQRLLVDETGGKKDNPVATYLKEYYDKNPLDNSFEGIIARHSGMTKDDVIATLDFIEVMNYLANYHPEEREMAVEMAVVNGPVECGIMNLCFTTTAPSKTPSSTNAVTPILALAPKRLNVVVSNLATTSSA